MCPGRPVGRSLSIAESLLCNCRRQLRPHRPGRICGASPVGPMDASCREAFPSYSEPFSMSARMCSTRQAVMRGPSLTGFGKRPSLTPAHHVDLLTGIGPWGAMIEGNRTNPVLGSSGADIGKRLRLIEDEAVLENLAELLAEVGFSETEIGYSVAIRFGPGEATPCLH